MAKLVAATIDKENHPILNHLIGTLYLSFYPAFSSTIFLFINCLVNLAVHYVCKIVIVCF